MKISIIVPTYNRPKALKLCLMSLANQSMWPYEVLIADDGSTSETRETVMDMQQQLKQLFPIIHVWQEDIGFRKPKILNETVRQSTGDYLIFIDGDCMAHRHFVSAHVTQSDPAAILGGKRVEIGKRLTEKLLEKGKVLNTLSPRLVLDSLTLNSRKVEESIQIKSKLLRNMMHRDRITHDGIWGCNFSLYKKLFIDINGCDEDFLDGSFEDNDLGIRVLNQGKQIRSVRGRAIIFHLWHPSTWSFSSEKYQFNSIIVKRRIENKEKFCKNGIRRLG
ncbi:MAG TPA: glycosyltransferase family 2 protein [Nitrospirota bacterium]|nr:glycosyltransferase family 2 protein [Nitrospirota bacterium]